MSDAEPVLLHVWLQAFILGIVEGLTEFLPISSTGHLILAASLIGFHGEKAKLFEVAIQMGAMGAVVWHYRARIALAFRGVFDSSGDEALPGRHGDARAPGNQAMVARIAPGEREASQRLLLNVLLAFLPAAALGLVFGSAIKRHLFHPVPVAMAFIVGGLVILWVESRAAGTTGAARVADIDRMSGLDALKVGLAQCLALIPGTSRSGATIIGGMLFGLSRKAATEFSFFLAVPTLVAAGLYDTWKYRQLLAWEDLPVFTIGLVTAFASALLVVRWLILYVAQHSFVVFAWYRIVFGVLVLLSAYFGWVQWR